VLDIAKRPSPCPRRNQSRGARVHLVLVALLAASATGAVASGTPADELPARRAFRGCRRRLQDAAAVKDSGLGWSACRVVPCCWSTPEAVMSARLPLRSACGGPLSAQGPPADGLQSSRARLPRGQLVAGCRVRWFVAVRMPPIPIATSTSRAAPIAASAQSEVPRAPSRGVGRALGGSDAWDAS
jgi:hypothetical protein